MQQGEEEQQVNLDDEEEEPEVLDLENPSFDVRSAEDIPAEPSNTDIVDKMEFEEDTSASAADTLSQRSSCALPWAILSIELLWLAFTCRIVQLIC